MLDHPLAPQDISFQHVADLFLSQLRSGSAPSIDQFVAAFPHLADRIRDELPAIALLEQAFDNRSRSEIRLPKQELGGCELVREIGRGAMGVVFEGFQRDMGRKVAVKVLALRHPSLAGITERFELERRAMARLDHPHIVPVYSYGHEHQHAFLVMKFIEGFSLDRLIGDAPDYRAQSLALLLRSDWSLLANIGVASASGLQHAHEQGLIHRDIKPANLLIDSQGKTWITDFGLAKIFDYAQSISRTGDVIGTPRYMAPEQLRGICDPRSDVYSLGITLYELATGTRAWEQKQGIPNSPEQALLELEDVRSKNPEIPESLAKIIMKACRHNPEERYQTAKELQTVLERFASGLLPSDRRARKRYSDEEYRRRHRRFLAMTFGFAFAMPLLLFAWWRFAPATPSPSPPSHSNLATTLPNRPSVKPLAPANADVAPQDHPSLGGSQSPPSPLARLPHASLEHVPHTKKVVHGPSKFLERLADEKETDVVDIFGDLFRDAVKEASPQAGIKETDKQAILQEVDTIVNTIKEKGLDQRSANAVLDGYRGSVFAVAQKAMVVQGLVQKSTLSPPAQQQAHRILQRLYQAIVTKHLARDEANELFQSLTPDSDLTPSNSRNLTVTEQELRAWFKRVHQRLKGFEQPAGTNSPVNRFVPNAPQSQDQPQR